MNSIQRPAQIREILGILSFPDPSIESNQDFSTNGGMELRDYFAGKVMAQIEQRNPKGHEDGWDGMASLAYAYADAMIRVRSNLRKPKKLKPSHVNATKAKQ